MIIVVPKHLGIENIGNFLIQTEVVFKLVNKNQPDFIFDVSQIQRLCLLGQLILYKFISFTSENKCFAGPRVAFNTNRNLERVLLQYGFYDIIHAYIVSPDDEEQKINAYKNLRVIESSNILIAPQRLLRSENNLKNKLEEDLFNRIFGFYKNDDKSRVICTAIGELLSNFWSHATDDSGTVMVAEGNQDYIDICFADNGKGIITTLKESIPQYKYVDSSIILKSAINKGVTSKPNTNHMGLGLYNTSVISKHNNGYFRIISEGYDLLQSRGKEIIKKTGYWKGSIINLRIELQNITCLRDMPELVVADKFNLFKE